MRVLLLSLLAAVLVAAEPARIPFRAHLAAGLIISAPATWAAQTPLPGTVLVVRSPADPSIADAAARERARAAMTVISQPLAAGTTLDAFAQRCQADLEHFGTNLVLEERVMVTQAGLEWRRLRYRFDLGPYPFAQIMQVTVLNGTGVIVTCGSGAEASERWRAAFAGIGAGLRRSDR